jgi:hypothetical protein
MRLSLLYDGVARRASDELLHRVRHQRACLGIGLGLSQASDEG